MDDHADKLGFYKRYGCFAKIFIMEYSKPFLGKVVDVEIDRPLGSKHPRHGYIYPVNYGFIPGTKAPDGGELDVYVLGEPKPLQKFSGKCIAIIHRTDDDDDKLIVCAEDKDFRNGGLYPR